jgi:hypothetical protein
MWLLLVCWLPHFLLCLWACTLTDSACLLAVSSLLSFGHVESRIVSCPLNLSAILVHGGMAVEIFRNYGHVE